MRGADTTLSLILTIIFDLVLVIVMGYLLAISIPNEDFTASNGIGIVVVGRFIAATANNRD